MGEAARRVRRDARYAHAVLPDHTDGKASNDISREPTVFAQDLASRTGIQSPKRFACSLRIESSRNCLGQNPTGRLPPAAAGETGHIERTVRAGSLSKRLLAGHQRAGKPPLRVLARAISLLKADQGGEG